MDGTSEDLMALVTPDGRAVEEVGWLESQRANPHPRQQQPRRAG